MLHLQDHSSHTNHVHALHLRLWCGFKALFKWSLILFDWLVDRTSIVQDNCLVMHPLIHFYLQNKDSTLPWYNQSMVSEHIHLRKTSTFFLRVDNPGNPICSRQMATQDYNTKIVLVHMWGSHPVISFTQWFKLFQLVSQLNSFQITPKRKQLISIKLHQNQTCNPQGNWPSSSIHMKKFVSFTYNSKRITSITELHILWLT